MTPDIQVGTILIGGQPHLTEILGFKSEPYARGWSVIKALNSYALDREIRAAGWNFFFLTPELKATFFGRVGPKKLANAMLRLMKKVKAKSFNCLEVTCIEEKRFCGVRYATVAAYSRHIQSSCQLDDLEFRRAQQHSH